ncbi:MAG TPA: uroporphyrinogen decarboxylase family protein [Rubrivivax sp.]|nr:uroporphyrinogen decarboxylase family protein [Rubrivivax sp.]
MNQIIEKAAASAQNPQSGNPIYQARWQRFMDCVALKQPDRMPVGLFASFWYAKYGGITCRDFMYDQEKVKEIAAKALVELQPDIISAPLLFSMGQVLDAFGYKQLQWPGHGAGDNRGFQYLDREYMRAEEYDDFLLDPTGFYLRTYLPRIAEAFEGFKDFPNVSGLHYLQLMPGMRPFGMPSLRKSLEQVTAATEKINRLLRNHIEFTGHIAALGFPYHSGVTCGAPYDVVADYFRGATGMMKDMFRHKDKLLEVIDRMGIFLLRNTIEQAAVSRHPVVFMPLHWHGDNFMSDEKFRTFFWPSLRRFMLGLIDAGLIPMVVWEGVCTKRLEVIGDIPAGKCVYWFENTDMVKAFEVLGDVVALRGNVSASVMVTGKPEEVDAEVRHLVEKVFNRGGKLILDGANGISEDAPVENVRAMFKAARKYAG